MREGDHVYFLAPPDRVQALDRFFAERPPQASPDAALVEDFFVPGDATLGALAEIYGLTIPPEDAQTPLADFFAAYFIKHAAAAERRHPARPGEARGAHGDRRPRRHGRPAACRAGAGAAHDGRDKRVATGAAPRARRARRAGARIAASAVA